MFSAPFTGAFSDTYVQCACIGDGERYGFATLILFVFGHSNHGHESFIALMRVSCSEQEDEH